MAKKPASSTASKSKSGSTAATKAPAPAAKKPAAPAKKPAKPPAPAPSKKAEKPEVKKSPAPAPKSKAPAPAPPKKVEKPKVDAKKSVPASKAKSEAPAKTAPAKPATPAAKAPPAAKPVATKPAAAKPGAKPAAGKDGKKGGVPATPQPRFKIPFAGSIVDEKAAAAKLSAAAGLSHVKKMRNDALVRDENAPRLKKSPLSKKQLQEFKEDLLTRRIQIVNTLQSVESEALFGGSGSLSHLPQHMADAGSDTYDQSLALDIAGHQRASLRDIDAALVRIDDNTYGICELLGTPIDIERLKSQPWTKYSIEGAREVERTSFQR